MNDTVNLDSEKDCCILCHADGDTLANPLLPLVNEEEDELFVHLHCARRSSDFGFCWCCG